MTEAVSAPTLESQLRAGIGELGIGMPEGAVPKLLQLVGLLGKWNRTYNLTAVRQAEQIVSVHLLDSLAVAPHIDGGPVLDVGSGGGFPGLPLALARPELQLTLLDSNQKKSAFQRQAVATLGLTNVEVVCERVERWRPARAFQCIVSRAFSDVADLVAGAAHLLGAGGVFAAMKGAVPHDELRRLPAGFRVCAVRPLTVPGLDAQRHLVLVARA
jgi:16S rRNA (guanine527-N7)-methyltransferase